MYLDEENDDIQLLVACSLADIFRIYAPESPFDDAKNLKAIFIFLANQLKGLKDSSNPSFKRYFYLLEVTILATDYTPLDHFKMHNLSFILRI